jgi:hypothetical protein
MSVRSSIGLPYLVALLMCFGCSDSIPNSPDDRSFVEVDVDYVRGWTRSTATPRDMWEPDEQLAAMAAEQWGPFSPCTSEVPTLEENLIEFNTTGCAAYSSHAPLPVAIPAGSVIELVISHSTLFAPTSAEGRMLVRWEGQDLITWTRSIPGPTDIATTYWRTERAWEAGAMLGVHVSNHGANSWYLIAVNLLTPPE